MTRDSRPYLEHEHTLPDGTGLFAFHNLTADDLLVMREALRDRRARNTILAADPTMPRLAEKASQENERLDTLHVASTIITNL